MSRGFEKVFGKTDRCQIFLMDKARSFPYDEGRKDGMPMEIGAKLRQARIAAGLDVRLSGLSGGEHQHRAEPEGAISADPSVRISGHLGRFRALFLAAHRARRRHGLRHRIFVARAAGRRLCHFTAHWPGRIRRKTRLAAAACIWRDAYARGVRNLHVG